LSGGLQSKEVSPTRILDGENRSRLRSKSSLSPQQERQSSIDEGDFEQLRIRPSETLAAFFRDGKSKTQVLQDINEDPSFQQTMFYEEKLEADSYNSAMIEELFLKSKVKLTKKGMPSKNEQLNDQDISNELAEFSDDDEEDFQIREKVNTRKSMRHKG
jgi:hypothetical protein